MARRRRIRKAAKPQVISEREHAFLALDPGGTTGVAAAYVTSYATLKESLLSARLKKAMEVTGDWLEQARTLSDIMWRFQYTANVEHSIPMDCIHFAIEDFVLRMPAVTPNMTSIWVAAATVAIFNPTGKLIKWQQPSQAKGFATDARLKLWGLYNVGESAHERDAWRHVATCVNANLD